MKRHLVIFLALVLFCLDSKAQWYIFPGSGGRSAEEEYAEKEFKERIKERRLPDAVNLSIILPLNASGEEASTNFLEMYCGTLMAVRDLGNTGLKINVNVFDSCNEADSISVDQLKNSDIIFGPISTDEILCVLHRCPEVTYIVSPLEPKAACLIDTCKIVQSPATWTRQFDEIVDWLGEEMKPEDRLIVMFDSEHIGEQSSYLLSKLDRNGLNYSMFQNTEGMRIQPSVNTRILIASDDDDYINLTVRELGNIAVRKNNMFLYTSSRVRNTVGEEASHLYNMHTRLTAAYFIDYSSKAVKDFILKYRAFFNAEPGSFAFQGYDAIHYFLNIYSKYGSAWYERLPEYTERGLQTDYRFHIREGAGQINTAIRRVVYDKEMSSIRLQ